METIKEVSTTYPDPFTCDLEFRASEFRNESRSKFRDEGRMKLLLQTCNACETQSMLAKPLPYIASQQGAGRGGGRTHENLPVRKRP